MERNTILTTEEYLKQIIFKRKPTAHKGDFGKILIFAGSPGMAGAAILCGRAALKSGAGLVQFLLPDLNSPLLPIFQISVPEATCTPAFDGLTAADNSIKLTGSLPPFRDAFHLRDYDAIACGSGLGQSDYVRTMLSRILDTYEGVLVLDADALNMIAASEVLTEKARACKASVIITPHIGEARRLLHTTDVIADQASRCSAVCELARRYQCIAVLKGAGTLITYAHEASGSTFNTPIYQNTTGNPGMATAGSGDSLTGLIASLAAQGYSPLDAARIGVHIHGKAGDMAAAELGEIGITSSDIVHYIPYALKPYAL